MSVKTTAKELPDHLKTILKRRLVPMIHSSPGMGKSSIVAQLADSFNCHLIDIRLSQYDPTELNGFPAIRDEKASHIPMDVFPLEGDEIPEGKDGFIVFLDELPSATLATQAAAFKVILDKKVGQHNLHPNALIVAAGNMAHDKGIVNRISTPMQSRLIHLELETDKESWLDWGHKNGIDPRVLAYIEYKPAILNNFDPNHDDKTFACERTWHFASDLISDSTKEVPKHMLPVLAGTVGEGCAREFINFTAVYLDLPDISEIIAKGKKLPIPDKIDHRFAISGLISAHMAKDNADALMHFVKRMPIEFATITLQNALRRDHTLLECQGIKDWTAETSKRVM